MSRRRADRGRSHKKTPVLTFLLIVADVVLGSLLLNSHGAGPVVVAVITALIFAVFLASRQRH